MHSRAEARLLADLTHDSSRVVEIGVYEGRRPSCSATQSDLAPSSIWSTRSQGLDLVFVDGDHSSDAVREDWEMWHLHVAVGGHVRDSGSFRSDLILAAENQGIGDNTFDIAKLRPELMLDQSGYIVGFTRRALESSRCRMIVGIPPNRL